jgi:hypothetical protein
METSDTLYSDVNQVLLRLYLKLSTISTCSETVRRIMASVRTGSLLAIPVLDRDIFCFEYVCYVTLSGNLDYHVKKL